MATLTVTRSHPDDRFGRDVYMLRYPDGGFDRLDVGVTLWPSYGRGPDRKFVDFTRRRGRSTISVQGDLSEAGDLSWRDSHQNGREVKYDPKAVAKAVDRSANAIDWLLERYFARMDAGEYVVNDPPRKNPAQLEGTFLNVYGAYPVQYLTLIRTGGGTSQDLAQFDVERRGSRLRALFGARRSALGSAVWINGWIDKRGGVTWVSSARGKEATSTNQQHLADNLELHAPVLDFMLDRYFARMEEGSYVIADPPRMNPLREMWMRHTRRP